MPQPRGAMAQALRDAVARAPSTQKAIAEQQEAVRNANESNETEAELTVESTPETEKKAVEEKAVEETGDAEHQIEFLNDLPAALGWEAEQFYALPIRLADDEDPIPLGEIKDRLQSVSVAQKEMAQQRAALEEERQRIQQQAMLFGQANQAMTERMAKAAHTISAIQAQYDQLVADADRRREIEPGKLALEQQELAQARMAAENEYRSAAVEANQQQAAARQQWMQAQHQELMRKMPEWADPDKRSAKQMEIQQFAMERYDITAADLAGIDAKTVMLLADAMEGARLKEQAKDAVKTLRKAPKVVPKGVRLKKSAEDSARVAERVTRARQTKSRKDITDAVRGVLSEASSRQ